MFRSKHTNQPLENLGVGSSREELFRDQVIQSSTSSPMALVIIVSSLR